MTATAGGILSGFGGAGAGGAAAGAQEVKMNTPMSKTAPIKAILATFNLVILITPYFQF